MADEEVYYSAKHWAKKSEKFANETKDAKESAETAIALVEGFDTTVEQAKTAITSLATEEKNNIRTVGDEEEAAVTSAGTTSVANVKAAETTGVANVNKATSDGVAQIQAEATGFVNTSSNQTVGGVKTITSAPVLQYATANTVPFVNSLNQLVSSGIDATEFGYLNGVTSNIQTQLNGTVKTSGNQTIAGTKIYTSDIFRKSDAIALSTSPSTNQYLNVAILDKNNAVIGVWEYRHLTGNGSGMSMVLRKRGSDSSAVWKRIGIFQDTNGNFYTEAPTPAVADNSTKIATTAFVNSFQPAVTALSATSGTVSLAVNKIYTISVSGTTTFSLPTPSNTNIFNQIKLMMKVTGTPTINWGTTRFFNKTTPSIEAGNYDVYFDYDKLMSVWVCGVMAKGTA